MSGSVTMTNKQACPAGVTILDEDNQPFASAADADVQVEFTSSDETVAKFIPSADGLNGVITSEKNGHAVISAQYSGGGASKISPNPDIIDVTVKNSDPASGNFAPGVPVDESGEPIVEPFGRKRGR